MPEPIEAILNDPINLRTAQRFDNQSGVVLLLNKGQRLSGRLQDISTTGCFLVTDEPPPELILGAKGFLSLQQPVGEELEQFPCVVMRALERGVGLCWG